MTITLISASCVLAAISMTAVLTNSYFCGSEAMKSMVNALCQLQSYSYTIIIILCAM